ncbi:glutathione transferase omega-1 [Crepidotus variabilis]|uniref:Trafficking protein particle complex subunit 11 n=1 Tax=Crepidotus variabilis TaxID=179855 RepID=A0A9P6EHH2_9AGAR|nr:glutathione transferase omega-1 [Crepidotus variabilis]
MNSYPPELLTQLAPVMFVAGLDAPPSTTQSTPTSPLSPAPPPKQDAFQVLILRLRDALLAQRKVGIWQPEKNKSFQVILVDRDVRFPPRKLVSPDDPQYSSSHSPLSPLTPTSPLHPDGVIAPIWIRKHNTLVPSVFVLFLRIFEHPSQTGKSPLDLPDTSFDKEREADERKRDSELAADVALRKKITNERGIKLTVVLIATRRMLDDPSLDTRLTYIRRQSGLDSRAALFVLSPVSPAELTEFVRSLQQALYEPALEYYTAHSKRVRRKRNRHSQGATYPVGAAAIGGGLNIARPLRPEGWTVRYEYKMACFAEFRGEDEVALKHYQDAYEMLIIMFGSTAILPPRTKRWAEAKVLADCINIKIVKLYLYNNEHSLALSHHNNHIRQFGDFSRGWGIGEETFEFWSWIARQHRVLAELLEHGLRSNLVLPIHKPVPQKDGASQSNATARQTTGLEYESLRALGINPSHALHHPGFYYYMAARCTEMRRRRFNATLEAETNQQPMVISPGFVNEKKVEHLAVINELYTKSYELFKKHSPGTNQGQGRLTLWIAYRIAQTYYDAGKFDMAVRFFERIAKMYRRERWDAVLRPLLSTWYSCAKRLGDMDLSIKLLIELLGHDRIDSDDANTLEEDLIAVLQSTVPSSPDEILKVDVAEARPIFDSDVVFWSSEVKVDERTAFQLSLTAPTSISIASIPFSRLTIRFAEDDCQPITIENDSSSASKEELAVRRVDLGIIPSSGEGENMVKGNLCWRQGCTVVFTGILSSDKPNTLKVSSYTLTIEKNGWNIEIPCKPRSTRSGIHAIPRWLSTMNPPKFIRMTREYCHSTMVKYRTHHVHVIFRHHAPAYVDEDYPVEIEITNTDTRKLDVVVNFLLQPTEIDDAVNWIVVDDERSPSLIKGIDLGVLNPGVSVVKTLHLFNTGGGGDRVVDVSIQTTTIAPEDDTDDEDSEDEGEADDEQEVDDEERASALDTMEHLKLLVVPTVSPIKATSSIAYRRSTESWAGLADLSTFDDTFWDSRRGGEALVTFTLTCVGPWSLVIENMEMEKKDNQYAKVFDSSTDVKDDDMFPAEYIHGDEVCGSCRISFCLDDDRDSGISPEQIDGPGQYVVTWHRILPHGQPGPLTTSYFALPTLRPPVDSLVALLDTPPKAKLHQPVSLTLRIRNYHSSRSANVTVHLEPETLEAFVVSGLRNGRVPVLLPGSEEILVWQMIPLECGYLKVPRIRVIDRRKSIAGPAGQALSEAAGNAEGSAGELVQVIVLRQDFRPSTALPSEEGTVPEGGNAQYDETQYGAGMILVLP